MRAEVIVFPLNRWQPHIADGINRAPAWRMCPLCEGWVAGRSLSDLEARFDRHVEQEHGTEGTAA
jgi:hypothetical protein